MKPAGASSGAGSVSPGATRKRRRSQSSPPAGEGPSEHKFAKPRFGGGVVVWENLDLVLSLQGREASLERKIELAFNFLTAESNRSSHGHRVHRVQLLRMVSFIGNWVQSVLIVPENSGKMSEPFDPALDYRCWVILRVCIEQKPSMSISLNLLKSLSHVARHALIRIDTGASCDNDEPFKLFEQVLDCISSLFSSNTRAFFNAGVDLWASCAIEVINLAQKVSATGNNGYCVIRNLGHCLLEQFSSFLRFYANPKNIFRVFVDRILDPLLELLVLLHSQANSVKHEHAGTVLKIVEDLLSNGLFHPQHISGYFGLKNLNEKSDAKDVKGSYHKHLFERFKGIKAENKAVLLAGFGYLLRLFVSRVRNQITSLAPKGTTFNSLRKRSEGSEGPQHFREPLFEVFMQFMEPLVLECKAYSQKDFSNLGVAQLVEVHCMLKSINEILMTLIKEKIYLPTEDTSEGCHFKFLQEIHRIIISMAEKMYQFWVSTMHVEDASIKKMLPLMFTEIIVAVSHFLEMEYKVMGGDLVQLWLTIFALSAINASSKNIQPCSLLASKIANLSSQVICTFSELRQVTHSIFRLCDAVRIFRSAVGTDAIPGSFSVASLSSQKCLESLTTLVSSQTFRDAIGTSIKSMPEGQSSRCIEELTLDLTETLKWIKYCSFEDVDLESQGKFTSITNMSIFDQKAELLGRHLSELYTIVLDSITVTASNSTLVGKSFERLINTIRPSFSCLVRNEPNNLSEFIYSVIGRCGSNNRHAEWQSGPSLSWISVFFFRLYISCRSLYRQSVGLMPPDLAIEASESMGNLFIVCCGKEWTNAANILSEGYFAWIIESSSSLLDVIEVLSEYLSRNYSGCALLAYILHVMALQRLNDLNRQIKAFEFLLEGGALQFDMEHRGNAGLFKESCCLEAAQLTRFIMGFMRLLPSGENGPFEGDEISCTTHSFLHNGATWDLCVSSLDEGSLPIATWQLLCENIDIWSSHVSKKDVKNFFSNLLKFSFVQERSCKNKEANVPNQSSYIKKTLHNISLELLCDTIIYDQKVLLKNLTSCFCHALKKSLSSFINNAYGDNALLDSLPDLSGILSKLENKQLIDTDPDASHVHSIHELRICENLLNFLGTAPGFHAKSKPFLRFITYILLLERFLLSELLSRHYESYTSNPMELIQLFLSCRRAMKNVVLKFGEECPESKLYSVFPKIFGNSYSLIWLLRSVQELVGLLYKILEEYSDQAKNTIFSLVVETSETFSTLANVNLAFCLRGYKKQIGFSLNGSPGERDTSETDGQTFDVLENSALECIKIMAELQEKSAGSIPVTVKDSKCAIKLENCYDTVCWERLLCTMSCIGGFLRGLISALESTSKGYSMTSPEDRKVILQYASRFSKYIVKFKTFVDLCLYILFMEDKDCGSVALMSVHLPRELDCENGFLKIDAIMNEWSKHCNYEVGNSYMCHAEAEVEDVDCSTLNGPAKCNRCGGPSQLGDNELVPQSNGPASLLSETHGLDLSNLRYMKRFLLKNLLKGESPLIGFTLRELYNVSAAILNLKCILFFPSDVCTQTCSPIQLLSLSTLVGTAYNALQKIADMSDWSDVYALVWIDGMLKYLEVLGSYFTLPGLNVSKELYAQIVTAHLRAIGKCISLEGKNATLLTHEIGCSTKTLYFQNVSGCDAANNVNDGKNRSNSFKSRLRMSLRNFFKVASSLHLNSALQVIERALVGVNPHNHSIYEVTTGSLNGGTISSDVAAGIDCLYLVLESVSGNKRVFKRIVPGLVGALFNIVLHLQSPFIFYIENLPPHHHQFRPDAGANVLMCVEVITAFVGKHSLQIDGHHVSQCLHVPVTLFKGFKHLLASHNVFHSSEKYCSQGVGQHAESHEYILDRQFSVEMYAACCKLLSTTLRHQQREVGRCVAVLEDSVNILLGCLESADTKLVNMGGYFAWSVLEAIKCASFFRRIYEEMRQQRDILGRHAIYFLSGYITMFSGQGPLQTGMTREIDEALRPGVYALIDICEENDFQQLHTNLGEGPCRTTLANLVHDYKLHFQYQGKI